MYAVSKGDRSTPSSSPHLTDVNPDVILTKEQYFAGTVECVERCLNKDQTVEELVGQLRSQKVIAEIGKQYDKIVENRLTAMAYQSISMLCQKGDIRFFDKCKKERVCSTPSFWKDVLIHSAIEEKREVNRKFDLFNSIDERRRKKLMSNWVGYTKKILPYFFPQEDEEEFIRSVKEWFSSADFAQDHAVQWEKIWQKAKTASINKVKLQELRKIKWKASNHQKLLEFTKAVQRLSCEELTSTTAEHLYTYLDDMFTLCKKGITDTYGSVLTVSSKIMYINKRGLDLPALLEKHPTAYEVRLLGAKLMVLDMDLDGKLFQGKNIVFVGTTLVIQKKTIINVSGYEHNTQLRNDAASQNQIGEPGESGTDGRAGGSSGNVAIIVDKIVNPSFLTVKVCGGNGEGGQNGGNGGKGKCGQGLTRADMLALYPAYKTIYWNKRSYFVNYSPGHGFKKVWEQPEQKEPLEPGSQYYVYAKYEHEDGRRLKWSYAGNNKLISTYDLYMVVYGGRGIDGGPGGNNGLGGEGGKSGELIAVYKTTGQPLPVAPPVRITGTSGINGKQGNAGLAGSDGNDMAIIDRSAKKKWLGGFDYKKLVGADEKSKIQRKKYATSTVEDARLNGYSLYKKKDGYPYFHFTPVKMSPATNTTSNRSVDRTSSDRQGKSKAVPQQTILMESILQEFEERFTGDELEFCTAPLIIEVDVIEEMEKVEEAIQEEVTVIQSHCESLRSHEQDVKRTKPKVERVLLKIKEACNSDWNILDLLVLFKEILSVSLDMNLVSEEINFLLKSLIRNCDRANYSVIITSLYHKIKDKMSLTNLQLKENTELEPDLRIVCVDNKIDDVSIGEPNQVLTSLNSTETRKEVMRKLEAQIEQLGADKALILALVTIYRYLEKHNSIFEEFSNDGLNWRNIADVRKHLKIGTKEQQEFAEAIECASEAIDEEDKEKVGCMAVKTNERPTTSDASPLQKENFDSTQVQYYTDKVKENYAYFSGLAITKVANIKNMLNTSKFKEVVSLVKEKETDQAFTGLRNLLRRRSDLEEMFAIEKNHEGSSKVVGSTAFSLIQCYYLSREMLTFNSLLFHLQQRHNDSPSVPTNWLTKAEAEDSMAYLEKNINEYNFQADKVFIETLENDGLESSAYRLYISMIRGINLQVFMECGFAKIRLVENNNPKATKKIQMAINTMGNIGSIKANTTIRKLKKRINSAELTQLLNYSETSERLSSFLSAGQKEVEEWSEAVEIATRSDKFLQMMKKLFEIEGCHYPLDELQFILNTVIEMSCNYNIPLEQLTTFFLGENKSFVTTCLTIRILAATKDTENMKTFAEYKEQLNTIEDSRLKVLFGTKLQGQTLMAENVFLIIPMLSHANNCFIDLEKRSLADWINISNVQKWDNYEPFLKNYGNAGYFLTMLYSEHKKEGEQLKKMVDDLSSENKNFILFENIISRSVYMIQYHEIKFTKEYATSLKKVLHKGSEIVLNKEKELVRPTGSKGFSLLSNELVQLQIIEEMKKSISDDCERVFPSKERDLDELLNLIVRDETEKTYDELIARIRRILAEEGTTKDEIKIQNILKKVDETLMKLEKISLRKTQKIAILASYFHEKNILAQVNTGEGKSLIIAVLAILKIKMSEYATSVDIITSNPVLAQRDAEDKKGLYKAFGINISHNCDGNVGNRKEAYRCHVVYGDISWFEKDYLLHTFYNEYILGPRKQDTVIVDESDSMCLDNGANMLYLSHVIPGLEQLESLFVFIHKELYLQKVEETTEAITNRLKTAVLADMFGLVTRDDIIRLLSSSEKHLARHIWRLLINHRIVEERGNLQPVGEEARLKFAEELKEQCGTALANRVQAFLRIVELRYQEIRLPQYLKSFVLLHLDEFVDSACKGLFMQHTGEYVVGLDRSKERSDLHPVITIMDNGTGTRRTNSQWSEGLHQFLQLKNGCKITPYSLKAVFVSNVSYLKLYKKIHGFSGTLGSKQESESLKELYGADIIRIPTWKPKKFHENDPKLPLSSQEWIKEICEMLSSKINANRSILIICKTILELRKIYGMLQEATNKYSHRNLESVINGAKLYEEEYDEMKFEEGLQPRQLILSTNLGGRGTDIKLTNELIDNGGLHVVYSFIPENSRIEEQGYGRAARCGEPGSGQIIALLDENANGAKNIFQLKQFRDNAEKHRLRSLKTMYDFHMNVEEECFRLFHNHCSKALAKNSEQSIEGMPSIAQIIYFALLDEWAIWLDSQTERIKQCEKEASGGLKQYVISLARKFLEDHQVPATADDVEALKCAEWIRTPQPLITIALSLMCKGFKEEALLHFERVEVLFPDYLAEIYYYKGVLQQQGVKSLKELKGEMKFGKFWTWHNTVINYAVGGMINCGKEGIQIISGVENAHSSLIKIDKNEATKAMDSFIKSRSEYLRKIRECRQREKIVLRLRQQSDIQILSEGYRIQQEERIAAMEAVIGNIDDIIGHTAEPKDFVVSSDEYDQSYERMKDLEGSAVISPVVLAKNHSFSFLQTVSQAHGLPTTALSRHFNRIEVNPKLAAYEGRKIITIDDLKELPIPSVAKFWETLRKSGCIIRDKTYLAFKKDFSPMPKLSFKKVNLQKKPMRIYRTENNLHDYDYYYASEEITNRTIDLQVRQAIEIGQAYVEQVGILNHAAVLLCPGLGMFDSICVPILSEELGILPQEAQWIIDTLVQAGILKEWETVKTSIYPIITYILNGKLDVSMFPYNLRRSIESVFNRHFMFGYALDALKSTVVQEMNGETVEHRIILPLDPYKDLYKDLISYGILVEQRVTTMLEEVYEDNKPEFSTKLQGIGKKVEYIPGEIFERLNKKKPSIRVNNCKMVDTIAYMRYSMSQTATKNFRDKCVPIGPEMQKVFSNGMKKLAYIEQPDKLKRWSWLLGLFALIAIGAAPIAACMLGPVGLLIPVVILAAVGTSAYFLTLHKENRKIFKKHAGEPQEEFTTLMTAHDLCIKEAKNEEKTRIMADIFQNSAEDFKRCRREFMLDQCEIVQIKAKGFKNEVGEAFQKSLLRADLTKAVECVVLDLARWHLNYYYLKSRCEREGTTFMEPESPNDEQTFYAVIVFANSIIADVKKLLSSREENKKLAELEEVMMSTSNTVDIKEDDLVVELKLLMEEILHGVFDQVDTLYNLYSGVDRHLLSLTSGTLPTNQKFLDEQSRQYREERLSTATKSDFMRKDLGSILLKTCFQKADPSILSFSIKYNYPLGAHSGHVIFKAVTQIIANLEKDRKRIIIRLFRNNAEIYTYFAVNKRGTKEDVVEIRLQLKDNYFYITDADHDCFSNNSTGLFETLQMKLNSFACYYASGHKLFQEHMADKVRNHSEEEHESDWKGTEKWNSNEKLIPPVRF